MSGKRDYKFGHQESTRNRGASAKRLNRGQSAKTFDEKDLRSVKLTTRDYMEREQS